MSNEAMTTQQRTFSSEPKVQAQTVGPSTQAVTPSSIILSGPTKVDLSVYRGDSGRFRVSVTDENDVPIDLTGVTWDADIRLKANDTGALTSFDVTPVLGDPSSIDVSLSAESSMLLNSSCVYDIEMRAGEQVTTIIHGSIIITPDVSRP